MPLSVGDRLGPYEILALIGAGGMGEVYKALDARLQRQVAVKVSHAQFSERFSSEARAIAALNQTNVCHLYDVGPNYLVMEHVEGETLKGPLPFDEALPIIQQLVDGLEAAHEKHIIHRDLKPANIKITPAGVVKILDFGLAKARDPRSETDGSPDNSPTLTVGATEVGTILGTAAYMSPEQAKGKQADSRADIWSFGVVVYELLTGAQPFRGESIVETLAAVIGAEPDFSKVPRQAQGLLRWCLEKDRKKRLASISDARRLLNEPDVLFPATGGSPTQPARGIRRWLWPSIAALSVIVAAGSVALWVNRPTPPSPIVSRFLIDAPPGTAFRFDFTATSLSPDGRAIVFSVVRQGENVRVLFLRGLDSLEARMLPGTEDADTPFWSPDSKSIAFFSEHKLKRIDLAGGAPLVLCDLSTDTDRAEATGAWNRDGVIIFGSSQGLMRVPAVGGVPVPVTRISTADQETAHVYPQFLPDGKHFIYLARGGNPKTRGIYAASLERPDERVHLAQTELKALYVKPTAGYPGYLLLLREGTMLAERFDADRLRVDGDPVPAASPVGFRRNNAWASFWASENGVLSYRASSEFDKMSLVWITRDGKRSGAATPDDLYSSMRISPDGRRLAIGRRDVNGVDDTWILDFDRSLMSRSTFDPNRDTWPAWSPDGRRIAFASNRSGVYQLYWKNAAGGGGNEEQLTTTAYPKVLDDWTRDGKYLLYDEEDPKTRDDIWALPASASPQERRPIVVIRTPFDENSAQVSPDGKWIAYSSNESGRFEVYIRPFLPVGIQTSDGKWQVSTEGGVSPRWRADGKELFFLPPEKLKMMSASVRSLGGRLETDRPRELFSVAVPTGNAWPYDVTPDGQRFLVQEVSAANSRTAPLTVVVNWQAALGR